MKHYILSSLLLSLLLLSCGSKDKNQTEETEGTEVLELKPASTEITGEMEGCFTVVDRTYKVKLEEFLGGVITVELKRTDMPLPFSTEGRMLYSMGSYSASSYVQVGFGIDILDADGNIIDKTSATSSGLAGPYSPDECVELVKLSEGKTGTIRFSISSDATDATSFRISSAFRYGGSDSPADVDNSSDVSYNEISGIEDTEDDSYAESSNGKGTQNWDSLLDSYEKFATKYIAFYKKVKAGTVSITSPEYLEYAQEAAEFADKLSDVSSELTTSQSVRLSKITAKISSAIQ